MTSEPPERSCLILMAAVVVMVTAWFLASSIFAGGTDSIHSSIATFIVWGTGGGAWGQKRGRDEIQAAAFFSVLTILCSATTQGFIPILHLNVSTNQWIFKP